MDAQITSLKQKLKEMQSAHRASEAALRKRQFKVEAEVENWIGKYDTEMRDKQTEIDDVLQQLTDEQAQLRELESRLSVLEAQYNIVMEEHRLEVCKTLSCMCISRSLVCSSSLSSIFFAF